MNDLNIAGSTKEKNEKNQTKIGHTELSMKVKGLNGRYNRLLDLQSKQATVLEDLVNNLGDLNERLSRLESKIA